MPEPQPSPAEGTVLLRGGEVVTADGLVRADVLVRDGVVAAVGAGLEVPADALVLDAGGCVVGPGLVDLHVHLREPGGEESETIETGGRAAALGGYTAVVAMPNTEPAIDCAPVVRDVLALAGGAACDVAVAGAITVGRAGGQLAPMAEMAALGVRLFTDDGRGVQDAGLMRRALEYAGGLGVTLAQHCEDDALAAGGQMHEGAWSSKLGMPGQPAVAEEAMVARDLALAALTGAPLHLLHLSTAGSVELVRRAREAGTRVTAEVTPHHLTLTDAEVAGFDPVFKVNPPLRTDADVEALRAALAAGVVDAVATDHAPHTPERKDEPFDQAPPGMLGLETALAVVHTALVANGYDAPEQAARLSMVDLFDRCSTRPAAIAGLDDAGHGGPVEVGRPGNLCVFDPAATWTVDPSRLASRSRNTPYAGHELRGRVRHTLLRGEPVVVDGEARR
jgi:dihydroorotase